MKMSVVFFKGYENEICSSRIQIFFTLCLYLFYLLTSTLVYCRYELIVAEIIAFYFVNPLKFSGNYITFTLK
jgi:hypothetical protein